MRNEDQIKRELRRVGTELRNAKSGTRAEAELYGSQQALAWALGEDVMTPARSAKQNGHTPADAHA